MGANPNGRNNEGIIANFPIQEKDNYFLQVSQSICKIKTNLQFGTGFFMKIPINNDFFYFLMTNEHVITKDMVKNNEKIIVYYFVGRKNFEIDLNLKERYIK